LLSPTMQKIEAGIAQRYSTGLWAEWSGFESCVQTCSEARPTSCTMATRPLSLGVKRPGHEADHSLPFSAEVKNAWSYTSTPPIRLHGVVLI
jgi:hypothetical protein